MCLCRVRLSAVPGIVHVFLPLSADVHSPAHVVHVGSHTHTHAPWFCPASLGSHEVLTMTCLSADSPGVPPSANAHHLFRGFSFVASSLVQEPSQQDVPKAPIHPIVQVCLIAQELSPQP
jgi:hypothetical protein